MKARKYIEENGWDKLLTGEVKGGGVTDTGIEYDWPPHQWEAIKRVIDDSPHQVPSRLWVEIDN